MLAVCLEDVGSGAGIVRRYVQRGSAEVRGAVDVIGAAGAGDGGASTVVAEAIETLGSFLALFIGLFDPHALVIGGGLATGAQSIRERAADAARSRIWAQVARSTPILPGALGGDADRLLGPPASGRHLGLHLFRAVRVHSRFGTEPAPGRCRRTDGALRVLRPARDHRSAGLRRSLDLAASPRGADSGLCACRRGRFLAGS